MTFELHVWGPGFGLPSIDAQCLALIARFSQAIPEGQWNLIASDPLLNPLSWYTSFPSPQPGVANCKEEVLPALKHGSIWVGGYQNIVDYMLGKSRSGWDLDNGLSKEALANIVA